LNDRRLTGEHVSAPSVFASTPTGIGAQYAMAILREVGIGKLENLKPNLHHIAGHDGCPLFQYRVIPLDRT